MLNKAQQKVSDLVTDMRDAADGILDSFAMLEEADGKEEKEKDEAKDELVTTGEELVTSIEELMPKLTALIAALTE
jgi:hypothetical protein